jgi:hypothetical protein
MDTAPLINKINEKKREIARYEQSIATLRIEVGAYVDALELLGISAEIAQGYVAMGEMLGEFPSTKRIRKARGMSPQWAQILLDVSEPGNTEFGYSSINAACDLRGFDVKGNVARAQMKQYVDTRMVDRVSDGKFKVTDAGRKAATEALSLSEAGGEKSSEAPGETASGGFRPPLAIVS